MSSQSNIDEFINFLEANNLFLCPYLDMEEKYCGNYRKKYKEYTGGFCLAQKDEDCKVRFHKWDDCVPYDKEWFENYKKNKTIEKLEKRFHSLVEWM